ncbi:conserved hypothetical protein [Theileria equi strain WA]|uniref:Uncharacterized protein n=1 Tax=Theileria equi strain WA TaxID=1537102 RepID=L1LBT2_THEEQ|nr:conserved hypothetical protein [Theileria equi strain WA]EKX72638.1 conserved hypothetical protein [Theileria equi strain WA]|eukprot:XP_004832090.1 conserved hypothetical protein [Theileria equi strain WA]
MIRISHSNILRSAKFPTGNGDIDGSSLYYFKRFIKGTKSINKLKTLNTIKNFHKIDPNNRRKYVFSGERRLHLHSIPKPRIISKITFQKGHFQETRILPYDFYSCVVRSLVGVKLNYLDIKRSQVIRECTEVYPFELKSILYNFARIYSYKMDVEELGQFEELLRLGTDSNNNSLLLLYLSTRKTIPRNLLEDNKILVKLLRFISHGHPALDFNAS